MKKKIINSLIIIIVILSIFFIFSACDKHEHELGRNRVEFEIRDFNVLKTIFANGIMVPDSYNNERIRVFTNLPYTSEGFEELIAKDEKIESIVSAQWEGVIGNYKLFVVIYKVSTMPEINTDSITVNNKECYVKNGALAYLDYDNMLTYSFVLEKTNQADRDELIIQYFTELTKNYI